MYYNPCIDRCAAGQMSYCDTVTISNITTNLFYYHKPRSLSRAFSLQHMVQEHIVYCVVGSVVIMATV